MSPQLATLAPALRQPQSGGYDLPQRSAIKRVWPPQTANLEKQRLRTERLFHRLQSAQTSVAFTTRALLRALSAAQTRRASAASSNQRLNELTKRQMAAVKTCQDALAAFLLTQTPP
jgi:hypothetical protein